MRQTVGIDGKVALDARNQFASIVTFLFRRIGVLHALRVNNQKGRLLMPAMALPLCANHLFLRRSPGDWGHRRRLSSICANRRSMSATPGTLPATSATGTRFSEHTEHRRKLHINQPYVASFSCAPSPGSSGCF